MFSIHISRHFPIVYFSSRHRTQSSYAIQSETNSLAVIRAYLPTPTCTNGAWDAVFQVWWHRSISWFGTPHLAAESRKLRVSQALAVHLRLGVVFRSTPRFSRSRRTQTRRIAPHAPVPGSVDKIDVRNASTGPYGVCLVQRTLRKGARSAGCRPWGSTCADRRR